MSTEVDADAAVTPSRTVDVVVVGAGLAGRMAAVAAAGSATVALVTDGPVARSNSIMAQGGLHVPVDDRDEDAMVADVLASARTEVDDERVRAFVADAREVVDRLRDWGLELDHADGDLRRRRAGGMSRARVLTAGDSIGPPLLDLLAGRLEVDGVEVLDHRRVVDLVETGDAVEVRFDDEAPRVAGAVVVATGGGSFGHAERSGLRTTNPRNRNHQFQQVLADRGLRTVHDDLWQWQPFGLLDGPAGPPGRCVPETLASAGPRLVDRHGEELVALPADRLELTRAMVDHVDERGVDGPGGPGFLLTLSDVPVDVVEHEFPKTARLLDAMGALGRDVRVMPFLHYQLGGLWVDVDQHTSMDRVLAAGEVTGGIHGRNRLMGAGVTEALVSGWRAGLRAADLARS